MVILELLTWELRDCGTPKIPKTHQEHQAIWLQRWCAVKTMVLQLITSPWVSLHMSACSVKGRITARTGKKSETTFSRSKSRLEKQKFQGIGALKQLILSIDSFRENLETGSVRKVLKSWKITSGSVASTGTLFLINKSKLHLFHLHQKTISMQNTLTVNGKMQILNKCNNTKQNWSDQAFKSCLMDTTTMNLYIRLRNEMDQQA